MSFQIIGDYLRIYICGHERRYPNNPIGFKLMARAFCRSKDIDL